MCGRATVPKESPVATVDPSSWGILVPCDSHQIFHAPTPNSDPEVSKEDGRAVRQLYLDRVNATHGKRLSQGCTSRQNPAQSVDKQDIVSSSPRFV